MAQGKFKSNKKNISKDIKMKEKAKGAAFQRRHSKLK